MKTFDTILDEYYTRKGQRCKQAGPVDNTDLLLSKAIEGRATTEEQQRLRELCAQQPELEDLLNAQKRPFEQFLSQPLPSGKAILRLQPRTVRLMPMLVRFAACIVVMAGGLVVYNHLQSRQVPRPIDDKGKTVPIAASDTIRTRGPAPGGTGTATTNEPGAVTNAAAVSGAR